MEIFYRHCFSSDASRGKERPLGFSREKCYRNFVETVDLELCNVTLLLDVAKGKREEHFLAKEDRFRFIEISEGTEAGSFLRLIEMASSLQREKETIVYFVEDDYLHRPGWCQILLEAFTVSGVDYATLYDHKDKYFYDVYSGLRSKLFITKSCHWRTTPSTTNTYAMRLSTLQDDLNIHRKYSEGKKISDDHQKFLALGRRGATLVSSVPGYSTHAEPMYASPCIDWNPLFEDES